MKTLTTILTCAALLAASPVLASEWGGHHGTIYLSIDSAEEVVSVGTSPLKGQAGVIVEVTAILADLDPLLHDGERVLATGGFELKLAAEGADHFEVVNKAISVKHLDLSQENEGCVVGLYPDLSLKDGSVALVTWTVRMEGDLRPVRFVLDPSGVQSCKDLDGCAESGTYALWSGSVQARQHGLLFSAGFVPAYLNWEGEADLTAVRGATDWEDTGLFTISE